MARLFTPPLVSGPPGPCGCGCALTVETSYGFDVVEFAADVLSSPLDPWERWLVIHGGELLPDGRPRFRRIIVVVARQNGKTHVCMILSLYWQFVRHVPLILGTSTKLDYARESWLKAVKLAEATEALEHLRPTGRKGWKREANGEQESWTTKDARYKIAAANDDAGRSLTVHRLICDELRQHRSYSTWNAAYNAMNAVRDGQAWGITNMGDAQSLVLNDLRAAALTFVEKGEGDRRLGLFEWSAPKGANPLDIHALAMANPNLGHRLDPEDLLGQARTAVHAGGEALTGFKTEVMCLLVPNMDPAIDPDSWKACAGAGGLDDVRARVAMVLDVAPDLRHAVLYAAAVLDDGRVQVDFVRAWEGQGCTAEVRRELGGLLERTRPAAFGWLPDGPAAALAADLADREKVGRRKAWPPPGVKVAALKGETPAVCMGFADLVEAVQVLHANDPLLNAQVEGAEWLHRGNTKVFSRKGGHVNAVYAAAGAVHLARTMPRPVGKPRVIVASGTTRVR